MMTTLQEEFKAAKEEEKNRQIYLRLKETCRSLLALAKEFEPNRVVHQIELVQKCLRVFLESDSEWEYKKPATENQIKEFINIVWREEDVK